MSILQSIILGIIQGLTEFLPVSSSAHLVLIPYLLKWNIPASQVFPFDVLVQLGTLAAVIIYFWPDLWQIIKEFVLGIVKGKPFAAFESRMGWYLILATIPAGVAGLFLKSKVEAAFSSPMVTALFLFLTAAFLFIAEKLGKRRKNLSQMNWLDSLIVGLFQAVSIFPGVSRSGSTISGGMLREYDRPTAARFSFLMSIPVMLAAGALSVKDLLDVPQLSSFLPVMAIGFVTAAVVGYFSIRWLLSFLQKRSLMAFAIYCAALAVAVLGVILLRAPSAAQANAAAETPVLSKDSPVVLRLTYTPALDGSTEAFSSCAGQLSGTGLVVQERPTNSLAATNADIQMRFGAPESLALPSYALGTETLEFIVNPSNTLQSLPLEMAQQVFSARFATWGDLATACPECFSTALPENIKSGAIALNFYAADEDIQVLMESAVTSGVLPARAQALLIPDPAAMVETVAGETQAIGYVPSASLAGSVRQIRITGIDSAKLELPVLAITQTTAQGAALAWLECLQSALAH